MIWLRVGVAIVASWLIATVPAAPQGPLCRTANIPSDAPNCASEEFVGNHFPSGSTVGHIATFADTTGNVLQDGGAPTTGVTTLNGESGPVTLTGSQGVGVSASGSTINFKNLAPILSTATQSVNAVSLTPSALPSGVTTPQDNMRFRFVMPSTTTSASFATIAAITGLTGGPWNLLQPDGVTVVYQYDLQGGQTVEIEYLSTAGAFVLLTPPAGANNFLGGFFAHGMYKLQAGTSTTIDLGSNDGGAIIGSNSNNGGRRLVQLGPSGFCSQNLFNGTANVAGTLNQSILNNTLYAVYLNPQTTSTPLAPPANTCLSFWPTASGYNPTLDANGVLILDSGGPNPAYIYVGLVYAIGGSITNNIGPAATMNNSVYSHSGLSMWAFGYQSTLVSESYNSATLTTQTTPAIGGPTEGIANSPWADVDASITCTATTSARIQVSGTTYSGSTFTSNSPTLPVSIGTNIPFHLVWESAPPMGYYTAQVQFASAGAASCTGVATMKAHLSQ